MARRKKKSDLKVLKIKRAALIVLGFSFFLFPGQNWYLSLQSKNQPAEIQEVKAVISSPADYPINFTGQKPPYLTARSVGVVDCDSAVLIHGRNEQTRLLPASTVKIMTALVALDHYQPDDILTVKEANGQGQDMGLMAGEKISAENLLYGLLVASANDAALVLAQHYPGGEKEFVVAMNEKAKELNLNSSHFANPAGLDSDEEGHLLPDYSYSTALDLARLASRALGNEVLAEIVMTKRITVSDLSGKINHQLYNINELLGELPGMKGVKTGWTEEAGECLVSLIEREGRRIIIVILGSEDRFRETAKLAEWVFENYRWQAIAPSIQK